MNYCRNCGAPLVPGNKFCTKCGAPVEEEKTQGNSQPQYLSVHDRIDEGIAN